MGNPFPTLGSDNVSRGEVKQALIRNTDEAVAKGVFGAPSFFVGEQLFWGQDRMDEVAEALKN